MVHDMKTRTTEICPSAPEQYRLNISVNLRDKITEKGISQRGGNENVESDKEKKKSKAKRKKKTRKTGFYSHDELIKIWHFKNSHVI